MTVNLTSQDLEAARGSASSMANGSGDNQPISEQFRRAAEEWVDLESAAKILEETKSAYLSQEMQRYLDAGMAVNRSEQMVKASNSWEDHVHKITQARRNANLAWVQVEVLKMRFSEWQSSEANKRAEMRL